MVTRTDNGDGSITFAVSDASLIVWPKDWQSGREVKQHVAAWARANGVKVRADEL